ncbi:MAG: cupin domain-containing protein [Steroidobacteraceae bacterium]
MKPADKLPEFHRIVTGHDADGAAYVAAAAPPPRVYRADDHGTLFHEVWHSRNSPALIDRLTLEPSEDRLTLPPPRAGTRVRVVDIPPETEAMRNRTAEQMKAEFEQLGAAHASTAHGNARHPLMHRTETLDYGICVQGEVWMIMDKDEVLVRQGDIVIQRGTNHAWANRSDHPCRMVFVLVDGQFDAELRK